MIWKVYCDNYLLHDSRLDDYQLIDPSLDLELNKTGSFTFTIYPEHIHYDKLQKLKSIITVYEGDDLRFRGRVLNDTVGWHNEKQVSCEGELAFLLDSIQRPFSFPTTADAEATPKAYFEFLIGRHNAQVEESHQFVIGECTVTDANDYIARSDTEYSTTWDILNQGLIDTHGGYLIVDFDGDGNRRINYLADSTIMSTQSIEFGENLLDIETERKGEDIATAILPLGKQDEETEERLTISDLPDDTETDICKEGDLVYSKAARELYGNIIKVVTWDDVTIVDNLLTKAKAKLAQSILLPQTVTLSAADLSAAGYDFNSFKLGVYIQTKSAVHEDAHALASSYLVKKLSIKLKNPSQNKLTVGATTYSFTEQSKKTQDEQYKIIQGNIAASESKVIAELEQRASSIITQTESDIMSKVSEEYYTKGETGDLVSSVSTTLEQTKDSFELRFESVDKNIEDVQSGADAQFAEINKYIRFEDGNIILGEQGNDITLKIENDRIAFLESGVEVAYWQNRKFYVTDGEFLNSLRLGKFAFIPRANGNLSFKKVVD